MHSRHEWWISHLRGETLIPLLFQADGSIETDKGVRKKDSKIKLNHYFGKALSKKKGQYQEADPSTQKKPSNRSDRKREFKPERKWISYLPCSMKKAAALFKQWVKDSTIQLWFVAQAST